MLEVILFVAAIVCAITLPGRIARVKGGNMPEKFANDPARYEKRVRSESMALMICSVVFAIKNLVDVTILRDAEFFDGAGLAIVWVLILGWAALAVAFYVIRRPLTV